MCVPTLYYSMEGNCQLDDHYTKGIWYDSTTKNFIKIREVGDTIGLFNYDKEPEDNQPYFTFDDVRITKEDAIDRIESDMYRVSDDAVENPASVIKRALYRASADYPNDLMSVTHQQEIDLKYARMVTEISE